MTISYIFSKTSCTCVLPVLTPKWLNSSHQTFLQSAAVRSSECKHRNEAEATVKVSHKALYHDFVIPSLKLVILFTEIQERSKTFGYISLF